MDRFAERTKTVSLKEQRLFSISRFILVFCLYSLFLTPAYAQTSEMEQRYNALAERFDARDKLLLRDLKAYLQEYPYSTFVDEVNFMQAVLQVEKAHYKQGIKLFEVIDRDALSRAHQLDYNFYRGYNFLMMQEYRNAATYFHSLSKTENRYTLRGKYYYAYCMYKLGEYDKALPYLTALESEPAYSKTVPYYLTQIYFTQGEYEEALTRATALLASSESENNTELHRMLGEIHYMKGEYQEAVTHLTQYERAATANHEELVRNDMYMLGAANYQLGEHAEAVKYLKKVRHEQDTISEAACLTLGHAYVALEQPENAKLSYQAAAGYRLTPEVTEEASYNYTL